MSIVEYKIVERAILKKNRSYEESDAIWGELQNTYNVMVDDKSKEWKVTFAGGQSKFAEEAARSQSSSYKQKQVEKGVFSRTKRVYIDASHSSRRTNECILSRITNECNGPRQKIIDGKH